MPHDDIDVDDIDDDHTLSTGATSFAMAWEGLLDDVTVSDGAVRLYLILCTHTRTGRLTAYPGQERLAARLKCSVDTIQRRINELDAADWIIVKARGQGRTNLVHINVPGGGRPAWEAKARSRRTAARGNRSRAAHESRSRAGAESGTDAASLPSPEVDEVEVEGSSSLRATTVAIATKGQGLGQPLPPTGPPEHLIQDGLLLGTSMPVRMWHTVSDSMRRMVLGELPGWEAYFAANPPPIVARVDAPSTPEPSERRNVIRRSEGLERALSRGYEFVPTSQADRRNMAKLLELRPTIGQLDGAIEAMGWVKGQPLDLGRLVTKWGTWSTARSTRPPAWKNDRTEAKDLVARVEAAGGNKYLLDGPPVEYM